MAYDLVGYQRTGTYSMHSDGVFSYSLLVRTKRWQQSATGLRIQAWCVYWLGVSGDALNYRADWSAVNSPTLAHDQAHCRNRTRFCSVALLPIVALTWHAPHKTREDLVVSDADVFSRVPEIWVCYRNSEQTYLVLSCLVRRGASQISTLLGSTFREYSWQCNHYVFRM